MKPLNDTEQSRRILRWIMCGSVVGFILAMIRMMMLDGGASFSWTDVDALGVNAFNVALIIFLVGSAGGMLAMMWNWMSRR